MQEMRAKWDEWGASDIGDESDAAVCADTAESYRSSDCAKNEWGQDPRRTATDGSREADTNVLGFLQAETREHVRGYGHGVKFVKAQTSEAAAAGDSSVRTEATGVLDAADEHDEHYFSAEETAEDEMDFYDPLDLGFDV